ncbi:MAG: helix-turn-helix domain-containing protein [Prevotellaceae bacterium]|jgi:AraC-like DNA-binding protein|nr:helix-turn-helix domain-containing protein [Prevotellaceae bacterium]
MDHLCKNSFWLFSLNDPELRQFYAEKVNNNSQLHHAIYIEKCTRDFSTETKEVLHLRENSILLVDTYLISIFYRLSLKGYAIIFSETFFVSYENRAFLKLLFFHNQPEGIIDMGCASRYQKKCIRALCREYYSPYDDLQASALRNLLINLFLLSPTVNYEGQFKSGHFLNYALEFTDLIDNYAFHAKKKSFYTGKINITEKTLDKSLQHIYHKTFKEILVNRIIIESMRLLVFGNESITQIAYELGYDISYFIKLFSRWKGMYPKTLRENYRKILNEIENDYQNSPL